MICNAITVHANIHNAYKQIFAVWLNFNYKTLLVIKNDFFGLLYIKLRRACCWQGNLITQNLMTFMTCQIYVTLPAAICHTTAHITVTLTKALIIAFFSHIRHTCHYSSSFAVCVAPTFGWLYFIFCCFLLCCFMLFSTIGPSFKRTACCCQHFNASKYFLNNTFTKIHCNH